MKKITKDLFDRDFEKYIGHFGFSEKKILDIGCGEGYKTLYFDPQKNSIYGLDIADRRLEETKTKMEFSLVVKDRIPFEKLFFDVVSSFDVLEHVENDKLMAKEMYRVLSRDGVAISFTPNLNRVSNKIIELLTQKKLRFPRSLGYDEGLDECLHLREYTKESLTELFKHAGFSEIHVQNYWFGLRFPIVENLRLKNNIPPFLKEYSQYLIAICKK